MISVVCCSIDPVRAEFIARHYHQLLGDEPHEVISVRGPPSLAEGYNFGADRAKGEIVIFSHDDIEFLEPSNWLRNLKRHIAQFDIVGLAGTNRLVSAAWAQSGPPHTFGQVGEIDGGTAPFRVLILSAPRRAVRGLQALDGLFFAARRDVLASTRFDARTFDGFHCYDVDFTYSAYLAGFRLAVACDLPVMHASEGHFDETWAFYAERFQRKHQASLPTFGPRPYSHAVVGALTKQEALQIMIGAQCTWCDHESESGPVDPDVQ
jgi:GT2 family glycosyltransferase